MTLQELLNFVCENGGSMRTEIAYRDMNFGGESEDTAFDTYQIRMENGKLLIDSEYWEPLS